MNQFVGRDETLLEVLKREKRPIVLYGMGNGADKILDLCSRHGIKISDIFASDEYVRGHSFRGYRVKKYSEICQEYSDCVILLAFAVFKDDLLAKVENIAERYTLLVPDVPLFGGGFFDYDFMLANTDNIQKTYNLLADEQSRNVLTDVINFRLTGKPELLRRCETDRSEVFENIIKLGTNEQYVDLGAYDGDTILEFLQIAGGGINAEITAFEPDKRNMRKLEKNIPTVLKEFSFSGTCRLLPYASWSEDAELSFSGSGGRMSCLDLSGDSVQARAVDSVCKAATYIKMDVEGAEYETLTGCKRIISECAPSLAVSAYHRVGDIFTLPLYVNSLCPKYKIYLRHHRYLPSWETNIYAVCGK